MIMHQGSNIQRQVAAANDDDLFPPPSCALPAVVAVANSDLYLLNNGIFCVYLSQQSATFRLGVRDTSRPGRLLRSGHTSLEPILL